LALVGPFEPRDQSKRRRLAAPGGSQEREELAGRHVEVDAADRGYVGEPLHEIDEDNLSAGHGRRGYAFLPDEA